MNEQQLAERIIALDEKLDELILARGEHLATEFSNDPEERRGGVLPKVATGAALAGAGAAGYANRDRFAAAGKAAGKAYKRRGFKKPRGILGSAAKAFRYAR
tara:strand:- start:2743 stop:3048 length:306 start_codon:yes stop_codon:yes gene_type:complete